MRIKPYLLLGGIAAISFAGVAVVSANDVITAIIASPGVVALLAALLQLLRDEAAFEKNQILQLQQQRYNLGAASHMANTAFDKHVAFCEEYMNELHELVRTLFRNGDTSEALGHAGKLCSLRQKYAVWCTQQINSDLDDFECAIRKLGANAHFVSNTVGHKKYAEQRSMKIDENYELLSRILGLNKSEGISEESMIDALKGKVREILGIEELTSLRAHLVRQASNAVSGA